MVKKLLKYEFAYFFKRLLPLELVVLGTALFNRLIQLAEGPGTSYRIIFGSSVALLTLAIIVSLVGTVVIAVSRFSKNLFSNEGYLTLALPVTPFQHIAAKLLTAFICFLISIVFAVLGLCVATLGETLAEICKAAAYLVKLAWNFYSFEALIFCAEIFVGFCVSAVKLYTVFYACISIGQRAKKNRTGLAVACFFIYYFALQVLGTVSIVVITLLDARGIIEAFMNFVEMHPHLAAHGGVWLAVIWNAVFAAIYFGISHHILKKKLNLE